MAGAGDVNGDGPADVIVGAAGDHAPEGAAFVIWGRASSDPVDTANLGDQGMRLQGAGTRLRRASPWPAWAT